MGECRKALWRLAHFLRIDLVIRAKGERSGHTLLCDFCGDDLLYAHYLALKFHCIYHFKKKWLRCGQGISADSCLGNYRFHSRNVDNEPDREQGKWKSIYHRCCSSVCFGNFCIYITEVSSSEIDRK